MDHHKHHKCQKHNNLCSNIKKYDYDDYCDKDKKKDTHACIGINTSTCIMGQNHDNKNNILMKESITLSSTTGSDLVTKVTLPIYTEKLQSYIIEWSCEVSSSNNVNGSANVILKLTNKDGTEQQDKILSSSQKYVLKNEWIAMSGFSRIVIAKPSRINLEFSSITNTILKPKNILIRNAIIIAKAIQ